MLILGSSLLYVTGLLNLVSLATAFLQFKQHCL